MGDKNGVLLLNCKYKWYWAAKMEFRRRIINTNYIGRQNFCRPNIKKKKRETNIFGAIFITLGDGNQISSPKCKYISGVIFSTFITLGDINQILSPKCKYKWYWATKIEFHRRIVNTNYIRRRNLIFITFI